MDRELFVMMTHFAGKVFRLRTVLYCVFQLILVTVVLAFIGCADADPFARSKRDIIAGYYLNHSESDDYYLQLEGVEKDGGGIIEGTVQMIGWSNSLVLAKRYSTFRGDADGWMVIDTKTHQIKGPLSDDEKDQDPILKKIACYPAKIAWEKLD